jgi:hypothetical protein
MSTADMDHLVHDCFGTASDIGGHLCSRGHLELRSRCGGSAVGNATADHGKPFEGLRPVGADGKIDRDREIACTGGDHLSALLITASIAAATAILQVWLKLISRTPRQNKKHGLEIEDALWWTDWVVAASFALVGSLIAAARAGKDVPVPQVILAAVALFVGFSVMPFGLRMAAYTQNAKIKGWRWVWAANGVASLILLSAVAAGVKVYG